MRECPLALIYARQFDHRGRWDFEPFVFSRLRCVPLRAAETIHHMPLVQHAYPCASASERAASNHESTFGPFVSSLVMPNRLVRTTETMKIPRHIFREYDIRG